MQQEWNVILQDPVLEWFKTLKQEDLLNQYDILLTANRGRFRLSMTENDDSPC
ncbi:hypothetical protein [Histophilus somni]|uniref:hypothetical protein n=1 Tax=Histophilus somni TaxID=731 RepID=UPI001E38690A|nr:hypothetical protein [Histophilus somni]